MPARSVTEVGPGTGKATAPAAHLRFLSPAITQQRPGQFWQGRKSYPEGVRSEHDRDLQRIRRRLDALAGQRVAVVGYGNQGRSWALNLRDSGLDVTVCVRADATRDTAEADGFDARDLEGANDADVVCLLVPDDVIPTFPLRPAPTRS